MVVDSNVSLREPVLIPSVFRVASFDAEVGSVSRSETVSPADQERAEPSQAHLLVPDPWLAMSALSKS